VEMLAAVAGVACAASVDCFVGFVAGGITAVVLGIVVDTVASTVGEEIVAGKAVYFVANCGAGVVVCVVAVGVACVAFAGTVAAAAIAEFVVV